MKKTLCALALSTISGMGMVQAAGNDAPATLSVSGTVNDASAGCTIEFTEPTVNMGARTISSLPLQGHRVDGARLTPVNANLIGNCTHEGQVAPVIAFTGVVDSGAGNALVNTATGSGAATGIGVGIYSYAGYVITPNGSAVMGTGANNMMFYIGMVKLDGAIPTEGQVQSSLTMQIESL
ncbi:fimbrial protein [Cronobacter universalis]|uniref:fimbrial protein n=1 Tax=Cronobacter universalis TaxID=535744 RepID=UPI0024AFEE04|nr:fimbrial protein [Cronobacter universalis]EKY3198633.1 type 1 fimbrial protein [Cronobacter turicensis]EKY3210977.1 type 1 fimbrial protein [Cronobacter turicensis]EKY3214661.1 type 1 fimbrial protein [Cronobacter turicensis]ELY7392772.1 type 1 fimbrial protein [Cronobacter universalis]MDI7661002.1 fimbrial protein [Cronobacter universalis]